MADDDVILAAEGLHKSFGRGSGRVDVLRGLDLAVRRGEFLAVMGPSGCGKSTLLHVLGLMTTADDGEVRLDGRAVGRLGEAERARIRRARIGFVFQRFNLLRTLSGRDNVRLALRIRRLEETRRADAMLAAMGVADAARRKPAGMSIGEQQRVAVARALVAEPDILLADEPTGSLDTSNRSALLEMLGEANRRRGQTIVMITHSAGVAAAAGRIVYMRDGHILDENG